MNIKAALIAVLAAGVPLSSSAFTLDAVGYDGAGLSPTPVMLFIPGYGEVILETANDSEIVLISAYLNGDGIGGAAVKFDPSEAIQIRFGDESPLEANFSSNPPAEEWIAIPESTSALLGLIGAGLILLRRRS